MEDTPIITLPDTIRTTATIHALIHYHVANAEGGTNPFSFYTDLSPHGELRQQVLTQAKDHARTIVSPAAKVVDIAMLQVDANKFQVDDICKITKGLPRGEMGAIITKDGNYYQVSTHNGSVYTCPWHALDYITNLYDFTGKQIIAEMYMKQAMDIIAKIPPAGLFDMKSTIQLSDELGSKIRQRQKTF